MEPNDRVPEETRWTYKEDSHHCKQVPKKCSSRYGSWKITCVYWSIDTSIKHFIDGPQHEHCLLFLQLTVVRLLLHTARFPVQLSANLTEIGQT